MGNKQTWSNLRERVRGKWQLPLLAVSVVILGGALYRLRPTPSRIPFPQALNYFDSLLAGRFFARAQAVGRTLLKRTDLDEAQRGEVELRLGRSLFGLTESASRRSAENAAAIVEHYRAAARASHEANPLSAEDLEHVGRAMEWQGQFAAAAEYYKGATEAGIPGAPELRKHLYLLRRDRLLAPSPELSVFIDSYLQDVPDHRLDLRLWAIEEKLHLFHEAGEFAGVRKLLADHEKSFSESDYSAEFEFLECQELANAERDEEAEKCLRALRNRVDPLSDVSAMAGWLLGRVLLKDVGPMRPQESLSFFDDVLRNRPDGTYGVASRIGKGEALAMLERTDEALAAYSAAIRDLPTVQDERIASPSVLRASLAVGAESQRQAGNLRSAIEYARLAAELIDKNDAVQATVFLQPLAQMEAHLAEQMLAADDAHDMHAESQTAGAKKALDEARRLFLQAAGRFEELASVNVFDDRRESEFRWRAAELLAESGDRRGAIERFRVFSIDKPSDPLVPRALLRVGQLHQEAGELDSAVAAFQECYRRFPRFLDGARALIPLARSYMAMGPEKLELAEKTLRIVLEESDVFTPEAPEFVDAIYLLGDVLERRGEFEKAIASLKEAIERYPNDARVRRARFLLADSYRKSASALRSEVDEANFEAEVERVRTESAERFQAARSLYRGLIRDLESDSVSKLGRLEQLYLQHGYLYEADCYFETQEYEHALKLYEQAASNLRDSPRGLGAYVQMINCYVFMGEPQEAPAVLARAIVVIDAMPDSAFADTVSSLTRGDWKKYFEWLGESDLF